MTEDFNGYHAWLGLDQRLSRPNYYQLLGVTPGETDVVRIAAVADRALARVRSFRPGPHAAQWSRLLDEIAAAKRCLTDARLRAAYDGRSPEGTAAVPQPVRPAPRPRGGHQAAPTAAGPAGPGSSTQPAAPAVPMTGRAVPMALPVRPSQPASTQPAPAARNAPGGANRPNLHRQEGVPVAVPLTASSAPVPGVPRGPRSLLQARRERRKRSRSVSLIAGTTGAVILLVAVGLLILLVLRPDGDQGRPPAPVVTHSPTLQPERQAPNEPARDAGVAQEEDAADPPSEAAESAETGEPDIPETPPFEPPAFEAIQLPDAVDEPGRQPQGMPTPENGVPLAEETEPDEAPESPAEDPEPPSAEPSQAEIAEMDRALAAARSALHDRQFEAALAALTRAERLRRTAEQDAQYQRLQLLAHYASGFHSALGEAIEALHGGDEIEVGSSVVVGVVEAGRDRITVRVSGANRTYRTDQLPPGLAVAIVDQRLDKTDPVSLVLKAAYLATLDTPPADWQARARQWFREASAQGVEIGDLEKVLDD